MSVTRQLAWLVAAAMRKASAESKVSVPYPNADSRAAVASRISGSSSTIATIFLGNEGTISPELPRPLGSPARCLGLRNVPARRLLRRQKRLDMRDFRWRLAIICQNHVRPCQCGLETIDRRLTER